MWSCEEQDEEENITTRRGRNDANDTNKIRVTRSYKRCSKLIDSKSLGGLTRSIPRSPIPPRRLRSTDRSSPDPLP